MKWHGPCLIQAYKIENHAPKYMKKLSLFLLAIFATITHAADFDAALPMRDAGTSTYYVEAAIGGHLTHEFMVDTGSAHVVINDELLNILKERGDAEYVKDLFGVMADGSSTSVSVYRVEVMSIGNCQIRDVEVAVFPGANRNILGLSALKKVAPIAISIEPPTLMLSNCQSDASELVAVTPPESRNEVTDTAETQPARTYSEHSAFMLTSSTP